VLRQSVRLTIGILCPILVVALADGSDFQAADSRNLLDRSTLVRPLSPNPYAGQPSAVVAGRKLFRHQCAACHGAEASGSESAPSLRSAQVQEANPAALFSFLTNGNLRRGMPSWSRLPEQRRWQIVTYLKSLGAPR
jgi:mono/diheme cytochrome c family protein